MYRVHCLKMYSWFLRGLIDELRIITGNYSCLLAELHLKRSLGFHMVQSYLPTILIVVISWVSFWMDVDSVAGRTTLGVTTLLTVSSKASGTSFIVFTANSKAQWFAMYRNVSRSHSKLWDFLSYFQDTMFRVTLLDDVVDLKLISESWPTPFFSLFQTCKRKFPLCPTLK